MGDYDQHKGYILKNFYYCYYPLYCDKCKLVLANNSSPVLWNSDPSICLYYGNEEGTSAASEYDSKEVVTNNLVVEVGCQEDKPKVSAFERLGYFSRRGKKNLFEKKKQSSSSKIIRTVRNDFYYY